MPAVTSTEEGRIEAEVEGWLSAADLTLGSINYAVKKIEKEYLRNYDITLKGTNNTKLSALKVLEQVPGADFTYSGGGDYLALRAFLKETTLRSATAELRRAEELGVTFGNQANVLFEYNGSDLTAVSNTATPMDTAGVQVGDFMAVRHRSTTNGVKTLAQIDAGPTVQLTAQVAESNIVSLRPGTQLAKQPGVEWQVINGTEGSVVFNSVTDPGLVLTDSDALFSGLVTNGDVVELIARSTAPVTDIPAAAGYYLVTGVGLQSLLLSRVDYNRTSEGVYVATGVTAPNLSDVFDWRVLKTRQNVVFLRDSANLLSNVLAGDWVRTNYDSNAVYRVAERLFDGLVALETQKYTNAQAPYVSGSVISADFTTASFQYRVSRAPLNAMAVFRVTDPTANFLGSPTVQVDDVVELISRPGPLDATSDPGTVGYYKVTQVGSTTLELDNQKLISTGSGFVGSGTYVYKTYNDFAEYKVYRATTTYPYSLVSGTPVLYKITTVNAGSLEFEVQRYQGYDAALFEADYQPFGGSFGVYTDTFDVEFIRQYGAQLYLYDASGPFVAGGTTNYQTTAELFAVVAPRLSTAPITSPTRQSVVKGNFKGAGVTASPKVYLLETSRYRGRQLRGAGTNFAPFDANLEYVVPAGSWKEPVDYKMVRQDSGTYTNVTVELVGTALTSVVAAVQVGDYLKLDSYAVETAKSGFPSLVSDPAAFFLFKGYHKVSAKTATTLTLEVFASGPQLGYLKYYSDGSLTPTTEADLAANATALNPALNSSFSVKLDAKFLRPPAFTNYVKLDALSPYTFNLSAINPGTSGSGSPPVTPGDYVSCKLVVPPGPAASEVLLAISGEAPNALEAFPYTVSLGSGDFVVSNTKYSYNFRDVLVEVFEVRRPSNTASYVDVYLAKFSSKFSALGLGAVKSRIDGNLTAFFKRDLSNYYQKLIAENNFAVLANFYPDEYTLEIRGFNNGSATDVSAELYSIAQLRQNVASINPNDQNSILVKPSTANLLTDIYTNRGFQDALAALCALDIKNLLKLKTSQEVKDDYVEVQLLRRGYQDLRNSYNFSAASLATARADAVIANTAATLSRYGITGPALATLRAALIADGTAGLKAVSDAGVRLTVAVTQSIVEAVTAWTPARPDIISALLTQVNTLSGIVLSALPVENDITKPPGYAQVDEAGTRVRYANFFYLVDAQPPDTAAAFFGFPSTFVQGLQSSSAAARRAAFAGLVVIPNEPSVRKLRNRYSRTRSKFVNLTRQRVDLENHLEQATDPGLIGLLGGLVTDVTAQAADAQGALANLGAQLDASGAEAPAGSPTTGLVSFLSMLGSFVMAGTENQEFERVDNVKKLKDPAAEASPVTQEAPAEPESVQVFDLRPPVLSGKVISNLFEKDLHDVRVTDAYLPYRTLNSFKNENSTNFAKISLADFNLVEQSQRIELEGFGAMRKDADGGVAFNQFILNSLQESHQEKFQIDDTLMGSFVTWSLGEKPEVWSAGGLLINDVASDQLSKMRLFFEKYIRLSELAKRKQKMCLTIPAMGIKVYGFGVGLTIGGNADADEMLVPFNLQFVKTEIKLIPPFRKLDTPATPISKMFRFLHQQSGLTTSNPPPTRSGVTSEQVSKENRLPGVADIVVQAQELTSRVTGVFDSVTQAGQNAVRVSGFGLGSG